MAMLMHGGVNYSGSSGSDVVTLTQAEYDLLPVETKMDPMKVFYITDATVTQQTVVPNPESFATEDLTKLQIDETVYEISGASSVSELEDVELTDLADGEILKYDSTEEKWVNSEAGSSDLDAVELTQSQYDALTPEQKSDTDKIYFLKDIENEAKFVRSPLFYSTSEAEIGVWTDGKPLYQKTIDFGAMPNSTEKQVNHNISDIDKIVECKGFAFDGVNGFPLMMSNNTLAGQATLWATTSLIVVWAGLDRSGYSLVVTLYYTKTTDVVGSGKYADLGVPAVHYDGTERVIGTWFGETLYEKSYYDINPTAHLNQDWVIDSTLTRLNSKLIEVKGSWAVGNYTYEGSQQAPIGQSINFLNNNHVSPWIFINDNGVCFNTKQTAVGLIANVTIKYIKTA